MLGWQEHEMFEQKKSSRFFFRSSFVEKIRTNNYIQPCYYEKWYLLSASTFRRKKERRIRSQVLLKDVELYYKMSKSVLLDKFSEANSFWQKRLLNEYHMHVFLYQQKKNTHRTFLPRKKRGLHSNPNVKLNILFIFSMMIGNVNE